jgi:GT2 family glycosyltransferase
MNNFFLNVGFVVPTHGVRTEYLWQCLNSLKVAGLQEIIIVGPKERLEENEKFHGLYSKIVEDPGLGLPEAINHGVTFFSHKIKYFGWLGDDDLITENSIQKSIEIFENNPSVIATYGACSYIDENGITLFINKSGNWASKYMSFLPNLIPQPGSIYLKSAFEEIGGLKSKYPLSFDFELFFNLKKIGELQYVNNIQGCFRWHPESLSVELRRLAVIQTSQIRKDNLPSKLASISFAWEFLIIKSTLLIGRILTLRSRS